VSDLHAGVVGIDLLASEPHRSHDLFDRYPIFLLFGVIQ
jgi:hypothetical protein